MTFSLPSPSWFARTRYCLTKGSSASSSSLIIPQIPLCQCVSTFVASARDAAPAAPMLLPHRFSFVSVALTFIASQREAATAAPLLLFHRRSCVSVALTFFASEREAAPPSPMLSPQRFSCVRVALTFIASAREAASASPNAIDNTADSAASVLC